MSPNLEPLDQRLQLDALGHDEQRLGVDAHPAVEGLERAVDPHLAVALGGVVALVLGGGGARAHDVEARGDGGGAVRELEAGGDAGAGGEPEDGAAAEGLVEHGGEGAAVDDARPARGPGAEVDDADELARGAVVEEALEREAAGAREGARGDARRDHARGEPRVRVPARPGRVGGQLPDEREGRAVLVDLGRQEDVAGGARGVARGRGEGVAEERAEGDADEQEYGAVVEAAATSARGLVGR